MSDRGQKKEKGGAPLATEDLMAAVAQQRLAWSDEAEQWLLSSLLCFPVERIVEVRGRLAPEAFYHGANRDLFQVLLDMDGTAPPLPIDVGTVTHKLRELGKLEGVGGPAFVSELGSRFPTPVLHEFYLKQVVQKWKMRELAHACLENLQDIADFGADEVDADVMALANAVEARVFGVLQSVQACGQYSTGPVLAKLGIMSWLDHMTMVIENKGKIMGLTTGIHELDQTLHGLDDGEGEICVIAARPGQGKTAKATTIAHHLAVEKQVPGLIFSAEMSSNQIYTRLVLGAGKIDTSKAITGMFSRGDQDEMGAQARRVQTAPLLVSDGSAITTADLRSQVQVAKRQHGLRWIMVDHLHLIKPVSARGKADAREQLVEVMETLQFIKKYYKVVVFLMVQLSRETDRNVGKPPVLADLSGSAAIEWYADHVLMLHRDSYFVPWHKLTEEHQKAWRELIRPRRERSPELWSDGQKYSDDDGGFARQDYEELAKVFVRKNRRGPTPEIHIRFEDWRTWFSTRMPRLNSTDSRDWQMGSYAVPKKKAAVAKAIQEAGRSDSTNWRKKRAQEDDDWAKQWEDDGDNNKTN